MVGCGGSELGECSVAVGYGAGLCAGGFAHHYVYVGVAYHERVGGKPSVGVQYCQYGFGRRLAFGDIVAADKLAEIAAEIELRHIVGQRLAAAAAGYSHIKSFVVE